MRLEQWLSPCLSYNNNHQNLSQRDIVVHKMGLVQASQCFVGEGVLLLANIERRDDDALREFGSQLVAVD